MADKKEAATDTKSTSASKKIILIVVGLIVAVGGAVGATLYLTGAFNKKEPVKTEEVKPVSQPPQYYTFEAPFVINYEDQGVLRYLQASIAVMARDKAALDAVVLHTPQIRNDLMLMLSGQSFSALTSVEGKEQMRARALERIQLILKKETGSPGIEAVYFTNFVMQ